MLHRQTAGIELINRSLTDWDPGLSNVEPEVVSRCSCPAPAGQAAFLKEAGLPYEPLPREGVTPGAHAAGSPTAAQAAALQRALVAVAQSRGDPGAASAIQRGDMDFFQV